MSRAIGVALALALALASGAGADDLETGDAAWAERDRGASEDGRARPEPIERALAAYRRAQGARPEDLERRWKLLRALHFAGDFAAQGDAERAAQLAAARRIAEEGLDALADRLGDGSRDEDELDAWLARLDQAGLATPDVARLYFWAAIAWGSWSRTVGLLTAVRSGTAGRIHRYARVAVALEPSYEEGGAYRLLGSLHAELPRVPFVSGWVDREQALPLLERARAIAPEHPGTRLLLAEALLALAPERRPEALALLEAVASSQPRARMRVEDLAIRQRARERLAALR